jgi:hypothetical protein
MKVNVRGYGRIPGTNMLAPKLGIDMTRDQILIASTSPNINVYDAKTHVYLTKSNIDKFFEIEANEKIGVVATPIVETKTEVVKEPVVEPVVNNEVSITSETDEAADVEPVEIVENEVTEAADVVEVPSTVEETTEEEVVEETVEDKPYQFKKKNKKKH